MQRPMKNMMLFPYQINCLCWKIAMLDVPVPLPWRKESDPHGAPSCVVWPVKTVWPVGDLQSFALWSLIKTESRTAKLQQVDSHCQGLTGKTTSEWMNQSLLFCSLPVCPFLILSFQVVCFWETNPSARVCMLSFHSMLPVKFQGTWMIPSSDLLLRKQTSEQKLKPNSNSEYLCQSTQRRISCNTFVVRSIRTVWSSIWSSTIKIPFILIDLCRFYMLDVLPSGPENFPKHHVLPFRVPAKK